MNFLTKKWIECQLKDGTRKTISPLQISDPLLKDILAVRADFKGAQYQWVIGLLQSFFAPADLSQWQELYQNPPTKDDLEKALKPLSHAFELRSNGPAMMQDFSLTEKAAHLPVSSLLIDSGSRTNLHFNKYDEDDHCFCPSCFMQALFTLQINAASGGKGNRVCVRGGGPLTTLLLPVDENASLWQKLWINVLPKDALDYPEVKDIGDVLPWMKPTRISEGANAVETTPEDVHPLQAWWSMPRRIRLDEESVVESGQCTMCGKKDVLLVRHYYQRHGGTNYTGDWKHPLTPYYLDKGKPGKEGEASPPISAKGHLAGRGYREWLRMVMGNEDQQPEAAYLLEHFNQHRDDYPPARLWCFGYLSSNMKAVCWYDNLMPIPMLEPVAISPFMNSVKMILDAAEELAKALGEQVKHAKKLEAQEPAVSQSFWTESEAFFYTALNQLAKHTSDADLRGKEPVEIYEQWVKAVCHKVLQLFDQWVLCVPSKDMDLARVVQARSALLKKMNKSKSLKSLMENLTDCIPNHKGAGKPQLNPAQRQWVREWWRALQPIPLGEAQPPGNLRGLGRGARAELRRCNHATEVVTQSAFFPLAKKLIELSDGKLQNDMADYERIAWVAAVLSHIKTNLNDDKSLAIHLRENLSELRFRSLLKADTIEDLFMHWKRAIQINDYKADVAKLADDLMAWQLDIPTSRGFTQQNASESIRFAWSMDYFSI